MDESRSASLAKQATEDKREGGGVRRIEVTIDEQEGATLSD
jgi:hypothetical protein